jgi:hypothetical protein
MPPRQLRRTSCAPRPLRWQPIGHLTFDELRQVDAALRLVLGL